MSLLYFLVCKLLPSYIVFVLVPLSTAQISSTASTAATSANNATDNCQFPLASVVVFKDKNSKNVNLTNLNSSTELNVDEIFPYQYLLLTCSGPFPVEWVSNVPEHYFFSYILDDEVRSSSSSNTFGYAPIGNNESESETSEIFTTHIHIGNETLVKNISSDLTAACQPVSVAANEKNVADGVRPCGTTLLTLNKFSSFAALTENTTMLKAVFEQVASLPKASEAKLGEVSDFCLKDELWSWSLQLGKENFSHFVSQDFTKKTKERERFSCVMSDSEYLQSTSTSLANISLSDLSFNTSDLHTPFGTLECNSTAEEPREPVAFTIAYYFSLPRLCPKEDATLPHLYFRQSPTSSCPASDLVNEQELLSLCVQINASHEFGDVYVGDNVTITCVSSIFYFARGMQIHLVKVLEGNREMYDKKAEAEINKTMNEHNFGLHGYRNATARIHLENEALHKVQCLAPVRKSRKWVNKTEILNIKVPEKLSFDGRPETVTVDDSLVYLVCNATGDPLPELTWSRLNNEKLPGNYSISIQSYPNSKETNGKALNSTWISSRLLISAANKSQVPAEYYGRYICTAKNRFETVEKVFLLDEASLEESGSSAFIFSKSSMKAISKTLWFWVVVALILVVLVSLVILLGFKLRYEARKLQFFTKQEINDFVFGKPQLLINDSEYEHINAYAAYLPYDRNQFEIPREKLEFDSADILGSGAFGTVYKGMFIDNNKRLAVAIKTVNQSSDKMYFAALLSEIKVMCFIGQHENVIKLIGACTKYLDQRLILVATEFCENGDLLSFLQKHRDTFMNNAGIEHDEEEIKRIYDDGYLRLWYSPVLLSPHLLLVWAFQIAKGMAFLSSRKVVHGDLAARNVLLSAELQPKIGDFGLSKQLNNYSNYVQKGNDLVPWRWLALESLQFMKFSIKSDVWAFGVVLYELFSLGQVPFPNYTFSELFIVAICQGERLSKPTFADEKIYQLMQNCWNNHSEERPSFHAIENELLIQLSIEKERQIAGASKTPDKTTEATQGASQYSHANPSPYIPCDEQSEMDTSKEFTPQVTNTTAAPSSWLPTTKSPYVSDWSTFM